MTSMPLFGKITILSLSLVNFRVSRFHVSHLTHETLKLCLQNTRNMSKTARVSFGVLQKTSFSKQKIFVLENILPSFGKIYWTTLQGKLLDNSPKQPWVCLQDELLDNSPRQFFEKSSMKFLSQPFFLLIFFHVMHSHLLI